MADLRRLIPHLGGAADDQVAALSVTQATSGFATTRIDLAQPAVYRAQWARTRRRSELAVLDGHGGPVIAVCAVPAGDRHLLASASDDGTVRLWDPVPGAPARPVLALESRGLDDRWFSLAAARLNQASRVARYRALGRCPVKTDDPVSNACSTSTVATTGVGTLGRPRPDAKKSANIKSGNNWSRCPDRDPNTLPGGNRCPATD